MNFQTKFFNHKKKLTFLEKHQNGSKIFAFWQIIGVFNGKMPNTVSLEQSKNDKPKLTNEFVLSKHKTQKQIQIKSCQKMIKFIFSPFLKG